MPRGTFFKQDNIMIVEKFLQMTTLLEILLLSLAICLDSFMSAFGYGVSKIKIPFTSALVMSIAGTLTLAISCFLGMWIGNVLSQNSIKYIAFSLLLCVGLYKFISELIKSIIEKRVKKEKSVEIKIFKRKISLEKYIDISKIDADNNKILSPLECIGLGFLLSIDSLGVGLSFGLQSQGLWILIAISFAFSLISIIAGSFLGGKIAKHTKLNFSYLSGLFLIGLAIAKLFI